jgi:predicted permease
VSPGYFRTMGVPLIEGRDFDERDAGTKVTVALVNRQFAAHFFGKDQSPVGRHIGFGNGPGTKLDIEIVGMVEDSLYEGPREGVRRQVFLPGAEAPVPLGPAFYVRTTLAPEQMFGAVRAQVARFDPTMPIYEMKTLERQLDETLRTERLIATLSGAFGILATLLAALGLYGVMAFAVERRTKELGLRMALGAPQRSVLWMVMKEVGVLVAAGLMVGLPAALVASRYVSSQLYGVTPADAQTAVAAVGVLLVVAAAAGLIPARRASSIDPLRALRYE